MLIQAQSQTVKRIDWHLPSHLKRTLAGARPPYYLHRFSAWMWRSLMALALFLAVAGLGFVVAQASQGKMGVAEWMLGLFVLPFLVLLTRPTTWRSPVAMVADVQGLYFIGGSGEQEHTFVPWQDIGALSIERHASGNGMIKTIVIGIKDESSFWDPAVESRFMRGLLQPIQPDGYRRLPLGNMGVSPRRTMAALSYLRQYSASSGGVTQNCDSVRNEPRSYPVAGQARSGYKE